jgi:hypothetical protein
VRALLHRYIVGETNHCPGCGRSQWLVGRSTAECAFCATTLALTEQAPHSPPPIVRLGKGGGVVRRMLVAA